MLVTDTTIALVSRSKSLRYMLTTREHREEWKAAMHAYTEGRWLEAKALLEEYLTQAPEDGPSECLLAFLREHNNVAPSHWVGYRVLTEK